MKWLSASRLIFFFQIFPLSVFSYTIKGSIKNEQGAAIPFATVAIENSLYGTISDINGNYKLSLDPGAYTLNFQAIGFVSAQRQITITNKDIELNIMLGQDIIELNEIHVKAKQKDPAYDILKKVIKNKQLNNAYQNIPISYSAYNKSSLEEKHQDSLSFNKALFIESKSTVYQEKNQAKEYIQAYSDLSEKEENSYRDFYYNHNNFNVERLQDNPFIFRPRVSDESIDLYNEFVQIKKLGPYQFLSPISSLGVSSYIYKLQESYYANGTQIFKIKVIPRFKDAYLFHGYIFIEENSWALVRFELQISGPSLYYYKTFNYTQERTFFFNKYWLPTKDEFQYNTSKGKLNIHGQTVALYSNYVLNDEPDKNILSKNEIIRYASNAYDMDSVFWNANRPIHLNLEEKNYIKTQDSIITYHKSAEYLHQQDSIYNKLKFWDIPLNGVGHRNSFKGVQMYINPVVSMFNPFGIGGMRVMSGGYISKEFDNYDRITFGPWLDFGLKYQDVKGFVYLSYMYNPKKFKTFTLKAGNVFDYINPYESISATFSGSNYLQKITYGFEYNQEIFNGVYGGFEYVYNERKDITSFDLAQWSDDLFGELNTTRSFEPWNESIIYVYTKIVPGQKYHLEPKRKVILQSNYPVIELRYGKGIPNILNSEVNFDFLRLKVTDHISVPGLGTSRYSIYAGTFLRGDSSTIKFTNYRFFRGSDQYYYSNPLRSFQLLGPSFNTRNPYAQFTWVHHFEGFFLNKIPIISKIGLQETIGGGVLFLKDNNFKHAEAYVGIEWPFRIKEQLFKIGGYVVTGNNQGQKLNTQFKVGIDIFNSFQNSWSY